MTSERRTSSRILKHRRAEIQFGDNAPIAVQLMNISEGGVRFVSAEAIREGEHLGFTLDGETRQVTVHDCKKLFEGFAVRSEFVEA